VTHSSSPKYNHNHKTIKYKPSAHAATLIHRGLPLYKSFVPAVYPSCAAYIFCPVAVEEDTIVEVSLDELADGGEDA
jgi:hypothetical protein